MRINKGFTMAELLITMAAVGVITAMAVITMKQYDKSILYIYASTFNNLDRAYYNGFGFSGLGNPFDKAVSATEGARRLCLMLVEYMNTVDASCTANNLAQTDGRTFGTVKFTALNGAKYYISQRLPEVGNPRKKTGDHEFFLIYVDVNGDVEPNTTLYVPPSRANRNEGVDPDIFAFAALDTGRICPLGVPEINPKYLQTRIAYITYNSHGGDDSDDITIKYTTTSKPYYISKAEAWGYYLNGNVNDDRNPIDDEPTSYNDYIRYILPANTQIYSFLNGATTLTVPQGITLRHRDGLDCSHHSGEECWVTVDKYVY